MLFLPVVLSISLLNEMQLDGPQLVVQERNKLEKLNSTFSVQKS